MDLDLAVRTAVVTGAIRGIGLAIAHTASAAATSEAGTGPAGPPGQKPVVWSWTGEGLAPSQSI